jgi:hypothetical protein
VFCWELNGLPRPKMHQRVFETTIGVPLGTGMVYGYNLPEVVMNYAGSADLTITEPLLAWNLNPPTTAKITPKITRVSRENMRVAEETANQAVGTDYL